MTRRHNIIQTVRISITALHNIILLIIMILDSLISSWQVLIKLQNIMQLCRHHKHSAPTWHHADDTSNES